MPILVHYTVQMVLIQHLPASMQHNHYLVYTILQTTYGVKRDSMVC